MGFDIEQASKIVSVVTGCWLRASLTPKPCAQTTRPSLDDRDRDARHVMLPHQGGHVLLQPRQSGVETLVADRRRRHDVDAWPPRPPVALRAAGPAAAAATSGSRPRAAGPMAARVPSVARRIGRCSCAEQSLQRRKRRSGARLQSRERRQARVDEPLVRVCESCRVNDGRNRSIPASVWYKASVGAQRCCTVPWPRTWSTVSKASAPSLAERGCRLARDVAVTVVEQFGDTRHDGGIGVGRLDESVQRRFALRGVGRSSGPRRCLRPAACPRP